RKDEQVKTDHDNEQQMLRPETKRLNSPQEHQGQQHDNANASCHVEQKPQCRQRLFRQQLRQPAAAESIGEGKTQERIESANPQERRVQSSAARMMLSGLAAIEDEEAVMLANKVPVSPQIRADKEGTEQPTRLAQLRWTL